MGASLQRRPWRLWWLALIGTPLVWTGACAAFQGEHVATYAYASREPDAAAGLVYFRARYYDPALGRYTQRDPAGLSAALNDYRYVGDNPPNARDPSGLEASGLGSNSSAATALIGQAKDYDPLCLCHGLVAKLFGDPVAEFLFGTPRLRSSPGYENVDVLFGAVIGSPELAIRPVFALAPKGYEEVVFSRGLRDLQPVRQIVAAVAEDRGAMPRLEGGYIVTLGWRDLAARFAMERNMDLYVVRVGDSALPQVINLNREILAAGGRLRTGPEVQVQYFLLRPSVSSRRVLGYHLVDPGLAPGDVGRTPILSDLIYNPRYRP